MKYLKKFNESKDEYQYFGRVYSDKLKQALVKNGISGGNGWEDGAVLYDRKWIPRNIRWGKNVEELETYLGVNNPEKDQIYGQIVRIYGDQISFNRNPRNYVCVIWDPECENECVAFFVEDKQRPTHEIVCDDDLQYDIFELEIPK